MLVLLNVAMLHVQVFNIIIIMKKNNDLILTVDLTNATDAKSVYEAFAKAKFNNRLTTTERQIIADIAVKEFLDYVEEQEASIQADEPCATCTLTYTVEKVEEKKPNFFKRLWRRLFKKSSR